MEPDDAYGDDEHHRPLLPPDDRLWRHPSEVATHGLPPDDEPAVGAARPWMALGAAAVVGMLAGVGVMALTGLVRDRVRTVPAVERVALPAGSLTTAVAGAGGATGPWDIAARVEPGVVRLEVVRGDRRTSGSGVMFRSDGHLLTNLHVVQDADGLTAVAAGGHRAGARIVGADAASDLAVLKVDGWTSVPIVSLGSAASLRVGQDVMSVGEGRVARVCKVRGLGQRVEREGAPALEDMIETDQRVAGALSGGALVDDTGAVIGIVTAVVASPASDTGAGAAAGPATGFATPIDHARLVAGRLLGTDALGPAWIGVEGSDLDPPTAGALGVPGGAVVTGVRSAGPAGRAGLVVGDVITSVDSVPVLSMSALRLLVWSHRPGDLVTLGVARDSARRNVRVRLAARPASG